MAPAGIQHGAPNALRRGLHIKRLNALTAVLSGGVSGLALWALFPRSPEGIILAFALYYVAFEEIHWRMHLGEWLPHFLEPARAFHLSHHDRPDGRFNVFLPLFDWLLGTSRMPVWAGQGHARSSS